MEYFIHFNDGATWPHPNACLQENIPETVKQSIIEAYYYLIVELKKKDASKRISAIRKYIKNGN